MHSHLDNYCATIVLIARRISVCIEHGNMARALLLWACRGVRYGRVEVCVMGVSRCALWACRGVRYGRVEVCAMGMSRCALWACRCVRYGRVEVCVMGVSRCTLWACRGVRYGHVEVCVTGVSRYRQYCAPDKLALEISKHSRYFSLQQHDLSSIGS